MKFTAKSKILIKEINADLINNAAEKLLNYAFKDKIRKYQNEEAIHNYGLALATLPIENQKTIIEGIKMDNLLKLSNANILNSKNEAEKAKALLMNKAVENFDALPQSLQVYVMRAVFNPGDKQEDDILLQEQVREYLKMEKEATAKKADYEAERMKDENEFRRWKAEQTKKKKPTT